jgi:hypothetical protein
MFSIPALERFCEHLVLLGLLEASRYMKTLRFALVAVSLLTACSHQQSGSTSGATASGTMTPVPADVRAKEFVTFNFTDVAVTTSGAPILRLGMSAKNNGKDPVLCDESGFSLALQDGTVLPPDSGAQNVCDPDSIDPAGSSNVVMFFDLPNAYTGPVTVMMRTSDNTLVGQGTTTIH